jgi:alkanesulfonate monooxygenase SsuD/methylene tetrahydromethanopterin reductase-like flavin-dependent oxidoreductase (luciferase family)
LEFRTGAGATLQWASQWWHPFGIDYPSTAERVSILEEGIHILDILWNKQQTTAAVSFEGKYFKLKGAATLQKNQKRIPLTIAAKRNKTMQIAAKYADIWESSYITPQEFASLNKKFDDIHKRSNNDNADNRSKNITKSIELDVIISDSDSDLEYKKRIFAMERGPSVAHQILKHGLVGKPDKIAEKLKEYVNAGVDQFFLAFQDPFYHKALDLFMKATTIR